MGSRKALIVAVCVAAATSVGGCEHFKDNPWFKGSVTTQGASPLIDPDTFEKIDLALLLDPSLANVNGNPPADERAERNRLAAAFATFNQSATKSKAQRNQVQERIIAASNQRCGQYKEHLKRLDATTNFILGGLTTATAGAGSIFTAVDTVRALAGTAAILSGVRAEFNESYFQSLTVQVLTDGLETKRKKTYELILERRKNDLTDYPVEAAIGDAVVYHQQCSLIAGLEEAALSIQRAENPGLDAIEKTLKRLKTTRDWMDVVVGRKPLSAVQQAETQHPAVAYQKADIALKNLKATNTALKAQKAAKGIQALDPSNKDQKALDEAIKEAKGKTTGDRILEDIAGLLKTADTELSAKKTASDDLQGKWAGLFAKAKAAESSGKNADETSAELTQQQAESKPVVMYYEGLERKWLAAENAAKVFIDKMNAFGLAAKKLGKQLETEDLTPPKADAGTQSGTAVAPPPAAQPIPPVRRQ